MAKARRKKSARSVRPQRKKTTPTETERLQQQISKLRDSSRLSKEVIDALKESEALYRSLVETSPDAVTVTDLNGRIIYVSQQTLALHGYERPEEMLGKSAMEQIAPEDWKRAIANMQKTLTKGRVRNLEYTLLRKDGSRFTGELNASLVKDATGKPKAFIGITRDISERKQADAALKASEEKYRHVVEQSVQGIFIAQGSPPRIVYANRAAGEIFGYAPGQLTRLSNKQTSALMHPDDRVASFQRFKDVIAGAPTSPRQIKIVRKDGTVRWLEVLSRRLEHDNKPAVQVAAVDITERKEADDALKTSEEKYRHVVEQALLGIIIVQGWPVRIVFANEAAAIMFDYSAEELTSLAAGKTWKLIYSKDRMLLMQRFKDIIGGKPSVPRQIRIIRKDGTLRWLAIFGKRVIHRGKPAIQVTALDVTERKEAEDALRTSEEKYRTVVEQSIQGIVIAQGIPPRVVFANKAAARIFGYTVKEMLSLSGEQVNELMHPGDRYAMLKKFRDVLAGKPPSMRQVRIIRKDGALRWLELVSRRIEHDNKPAIQVTAIDITERKEVEDALRDSEEKYSNLFQHSNDAIFLHDLNGKILEVNRKVTALFGYTRKELLSLKIPDLHPKTEMKKSRAAFKAIGRKGFVDFEITFQKKDGTVFPAEVSSSLYEIGGRQVIQGIARDITERKQAEMEIQRRLIMEKALAEISEDLVKATNIEKAVQRTLRRLGRVFNTDRVCLFQKRGEKRIWDKTHEWFLPGMKSLKWQFQGLTSQRYAFWLSRLKRDSAITIPDTGSLPRYARKALGGLKIKSMLLVPLFFEQEFSGALGIFAEMKAQSWQQDDARILRAAGEIITASLVKDRFQKELTRVLAELRVERQKLFALTQRTIDAQERERLYLASEIHDELLQGLVAVLYFLQMLGRTSFDSTSQEKRDTLAAIIKSSIDRGRSLISEVEPIRDPGIGLVQAIKKSIKVRLVAMPVKMRFKHPKKLPRMPFAVKANVLRIVQEALTNVRKHSQATRLSIIIATHDDKLDINFKDNGIGFDVEKTLRRTTGHFGLVSIQERAQLIGGQLTVTSKPGQGTHLHGVFPLRAESQ